MERPVVLRLTELRGRQFGNLGKGEESFRSLRKEITQCNHLSRQTPCLAGYMSRTPAQGGCSAAETVPTRAPRSVLKFGNGRYNRGAYQNLWH